MDKNEKSAMRAIAPFGLRMQADLKARLAQEADKNGRSLNAEIVERLGRSFSQDDELSKWRSFAETDLELRKQELKDSEEQLEFMRWMREQQVGLLSILEAVAKTDGNISPDFLSAIRTMLANRGTERDKK